MKYAWMMLVAAILAEVLGTCAMKWGHTHTPLLGYAIMYLMVAVSYRLLSVAMKRIPLAVSYAVWEGASLIFITVMGVLFFHESMNLEKLLALVCIISGIVFLHAGTTLPDDHEEDANCATSASSGDSVQDNCKRDLKNNLKASRVPIHT